MFSRELPGIIGLFVGFSTLKEYGVEKVFVLENGNTDSSQRNIIYVVDGEDPATIQTVAGKPVDLAQPITRTYEEFALMASSTLCCYSCSFIEPFVLVQLGRF